MKILRLTLAGFGPYKNEQHVDFERFDADGIFLIMGKTGAGKSSVLDAICYALYAGVPRYDGTHQQLRSDHCGVDDPTFVELDFRVSGVDYRVRRTPEYERPKRRGTGMTQEPATAELSVRVGDEWNGVAARAVDVAMELDRVLGLTKDQFLQVILLAQNRFQRFLQANNDERQSVLRTLFGTRRFERVEVSLAERKKTLEAELASVRTSLASQAALAAGLLQLQEVPADPGIEWFDALVAELEESLAAAIGHAVAADAAATEADACYRSLDAARKLQERRDAAAGRLAALDTERDVIDADRVTLAAAARAAAVWPQVTARRMAATAVDAAAAEEALARNTYGDVAATSDGGGAATSDGDGAAAESDTNAPATSDTLKATIDVSTRQLGALQSVLAEEGQLAELETEIARRHEEVDGCAAAVAEAAARIEELPQLIDDQTTRFLDAQVRASAETSAGDRVARVAAALSAATVAVGLDSRHAAALVAEKQASAALTAATADLDAVLEQRLSGHAGELASQLVEGEPCAVCGSTTHPEPALRSGEPVSEADIETARHRVAGFVETLNAASATVRDVAMRLAEARGKSGNKSVVKLESELAEAESALATAEAARGEVAKREKELTRLRGELEAVNTTLKDLRAANDIATQRLAEQKSARKAVLRRVAKARGEFGSVTDRVEHLVNLVDAATALVDAITETAARRKALEDAEEVLETQLGEHDFADEGAVETAQRGRDEIASLEARIRQHEQAVATATATLAEAELAELPAEPIQTDAAREASERARATRDAARDAASSLGERAAQLRAIVSTARKRHDASAHLQREYAQLRELAGAVQGLEPNTKRMRLETYVLAAQLEEIVVAANARLGTMTHGRFALEHDDAVQYRNARSGLGLSILDQHTGRSRATHSLSGGETFLASLALALGLAEVVQNQAGGITLDTLFIDEGFGSLDADTLETAMSTLDGLRAGGRTIGLISHVDTMKEQIPAKLHVTVTHHGHSEITESHEPPEFAFAGRPTVAWDRTTRIDESRRDFAVAAAP